MEAERPLPPRLQRAEPPAPEATVESGIDAVLRQAAGVQRTGRQAVVDLWPGLPHLLDELRLRIRERLREGVEVEGIAILKVLPWLWSAGSSGGQAMSETGRTHGYELRLSRYQKNLWEPRTADTCLESSSGSLAMGSTPLGGPSV